MAAGDAEAAYGACGAAEADRADPSETIQSPLPPGQLPDRPILCACGRAALRQGSASAARTGASTDQRTIDRHGLTTLDWSRTSPIWQGRALGIGRSPKTAPSALLTAKVLKKLLGVEDRRIEGLYGACGPGSRGGSREQSQLSPLHLAPICRDPGTVERWLRHGPDDARSLTDLTKLGKPCH
ncbi:hypothetical protein BE21_19900 [Sorangium cellulosum]|uniref:Uncharacterized protein n=1 Tax=Sorangium cellulosum TaxID=56 RepID=A0A150TWH1_SORCE|nr:hypothetical protein BE21_19900 [Sorangium cellulosum]